MVNLLHAADLHLDSPFRSLPPERAAERRREQRQLLSEIARLAGERRCDLVLLSGDLLDSEAAYRDTVEALQHFLEACRVPVFLAPGNHDYYAPGSPYAAYPWPGNARIFTGPELRSEALEDLGVRVWGAAFTGPESPPLLADFSAPDDGLAQLLVLHGDPVNGASPYNPIARGQLERSGLAYAALGHLHTASGLLRAGRTAYAWPGCATGRGFDETGPRGVYVAGLDGADCRLEFVPLSGRRYETLTVAVDGDPLAAITAALPPDTGRDAYRICLTGVCPPPDLRRLEQALKSRFDSLELRDGTTPPRDVWARRGEDSLTGAFLEALWQRRGDDPELADEAARLGLAALEGREVTL